MYVFTGMAAKFDDKKKGSFFFLQHNTGFLTACSESDHRRARCATRDVTFKVNMTVYSYTCYPFCFKIVISTRLFLIFSFVYWIENVSYQEELDLR